MPITSLKFRPGINKETTSYSNKGGWNDCDLVRFRFGFPEKLGGWEKYSPSTFLGTSRTLHAWANLEGNKYLGLGTEIKFYIEESETYFDITPIRRKVVSGEVVFDINGNTVAFAVTGVAGTTGLGEEVINAQSNDTLAPVFVTGVSGTGELGTATVELTNPVPSATGEVGDLTIETTVVPTNIIVTDFLDES
tara:strand:- start:1696 stop:2274 length:579 start_codon:yes stop_codon:yes gene_type:complete